MGADNQNQNTVTSEIQNTIETEQFNDKTYNKDPSQREIINEKPQEEESQQQNDENQHSTNQFTFNRPVTVSDVLEGKVTLPPKKSAERK